MPKNLTIKGQHVEKLEKLYESKKPTICLIHAVWCGHCVAFKPEWNKIKKSKYNTADIESSEIDDFKTTKIAKKILPKDGQLYFPMIIVILCGKIYTYNGKRSHDEIHNFVSKKHALAKKAIKPAVAVKPAAKAIIKKTK